MHKIFDTANGATKGVRDIIMEFGEKIEINTSIKKTKKQQTITKKKISHLKKRKWIAFVEGREMAHKTLFIPPKGCSRHTDSPH